MCWITMCYRNSSSNMLYHSFGKPRRAPYVCRVFLPKKCEQFREFAWLLKGESNLVNSPSCHALLQMYTIKTAHTHAQTHTHAHTHMHTHTRSRTHTRAHTHTHTQEHTHTHTHTCTYTLSMCVLIFRLLVICL